MKTEFLEAYRCHSGGEIIIFIGKNANENDDFPVRVTTEFFTLVKINEGSQSLGLKRRDRKKNVSISTTKINTLVAV